MKRSVRIFLRGAGIAGVAVSIVWMIQLLVLPGVVRRQVRTSLEELGLRNVRLDVSAASLLGTTLRDVTADVGERGAEDKRAHDVRIASVEVSYSPFAVLSGQLKRVRITGAEIVVDADALASSAAGKQAASSSSGAIELPFEEIDVRSSNVRVTWRGRRWTMPLEASLAQSAGGTRARLATAVGDSPLVLEGDFDAKLAPTRLEARGERVDLAGLARSLPDGVMPATLNLSGTTSFTASYAAASNAAPRVSVGMGPSVIVVNGQTFGLDGVAADAGVETAEGARGAVVVRLTPSSTVEFRALSGPNFSARDGVFEVGGEFSRRPMTLLDHAILPLSFPGLAWPGLPPPMSARVEVKSRQPLGVDAAGLAITLGTGGLEGTVVHDGSAIRGRGLLRFAQTSVRSRRANVDLDGCAGELPLSWNALPASPGRLTVNDVTFNGRRVAPFAGSASLADGVLAVDGDWIVEEGKTLLAAAEGVEVTGKFGVRARLDANRRDITLTADGAKVVAKGYDAEFDGITAAVTFERLSPASTLPNQRVDVKHAQIGKLEMTDGSINFRVESPESVFVEQTNWGWAGGRLYSSAIRVNPSDPRVEFTVNGDDLSLNDVLALATGGKASGDGRLYSRLPVSVRWPQLGFGDGFLYAAPGKGRLTMGESVGIVESMMDQSDPRFQKDETLRQVKSQLLESLRDFDYNVLKVDFRHDEDGALVATIQAHGKGRSRPNLPEVVPTLNVRGLDQLLNQVLVVKRAMSEMGQGE